MPRASEPKVAQGMWSWAGDGLPGPLQELPNSLVCAAQGQIPREIPVGGGELMESFTCAAEMDPGGA